MQFIEAKIGVHSCAIIKGKVYLIVIFSTLLFSTINYAQLNHFNPVDPTGDYNAIVFQNAKINGSAIVPGDEIGVFDGPLCVGASVYAGSFPLSITAYIEYTPPGQSTLPGAINGNPMSFKVWQQNSDIETEGVPTYILGGEFGDPLTVISVLAATIPTISISDETESENIGTMSFSVLLSTATTSSVSVDYQTNDGTAISPDDYTSTNGTLTIPASNTSGTINIPIFDDTLIEQDESFTITLSNPVNVILADDQGVGTINDFEYTLHSISGKVEYYSSNKAIKNTTLNLTGGASSSTSSNQLGFYGFFDLLSDNDYFVTPEKSNDIIPGTIISYDAALAAQIAIGLRPNATVEQQKAADVDENGMIVTYDAALIVSHAVGLPPRSGSHVGQWIFVPSKISSYSLNSDITNANFKGIVLGDVDGNWSPSNLLSKNVKIKENYSPLTIHQVEGERKIILPIIAEPGEEILSCDIILNYDPGILKFNLVRTIDAGLDFKIIVNNSCEGELRLGGYGIHPIVEAGAYLEILFEVLGKNGDTCCLDLQRYRINNEPERCGICTFTVGSVYIKIPKKVVLYQNFPNPFNSVTTICYDLPTRERVSLTIYNVKGELVALLIDTFKEAGSHSCEWTGKDMSNNNVTSGLYFSRLATDSFSETTKMFYIR